MHGELMEFNERLQRQLNYWQVKSQRQQEELVSLRGPVGIVDDDDKINGGGGCVSAGNDDISGDDDRDI